MPAGKLGTADSRLVVRSVYRPLIPVLCVLPLLGGLLRASVAACPFCTPVGPSLAQDREASAVVALAELTKIEAAQVVLAARQVLKGQDRLSADTPLRLAAKDVAIDPASKPGSLWLLFGRQEAGDAALDWTAVAVNETSYAYFVRSPSLRTPVGTRLRYFARYLEHPERLVAEDAYLEFAHAPYGDVAMVSEALDMPAIRRWIADPAVPDQRKGLYGLLLGLAGDAGQRDAHREFLRQAIVRETEAPPGTDFRGGFDGILGGYLLLAGEEGLAVVEDSLLANPQAAEGNVRHAITALRFCHEYGREIPEPRLARAMARLLTRPTLASVAIVDLSRWKYWDALPDVESLYAKSDYLQPATRRAVIGYLSACPLEDAKEALARLQRADPRGVAEAEEYLRRFGGATGAGATLPGQKTAE